MEMSLLKRTLCIGLLAANLGSMFPARAAAPLFENTFEKSELDQVPEDFMVLDGAFAVKEAEGNRFLELPGAPLDTFGVLFGPTEIDGIAVSARMHGTGKGRRFPAFGVSLNGVAGFRLQVSPAKKAIELFKGDVVKATAPYEWTSGEWTHLRLQVRKVGEGEWRIEGRAWKEGTDEPSAWALSVNEAEKPNSGRAAVWGSPFSGTPIRFDDFRVGPAVDKSS